MASAGTDSKAGRSIVVLVDETDASEAAFRASLGEVRAGDSMLVVYARPPRTGDAHYTATMKQVTARFDRKSDQVLKKYSSLAAGAEIPYAVREVEGFHAQEGVAEVCRKVNADLLLITAPRWPQAWGQTYCPHCNPYLRGVGRLVRASECPLATATLAFPCPAIFSYPSAASPSSHASWVSQLFGTQTQAQGYTALIQAA